MPVGLVAGDDALAAEVEGWLPWAERIVVKDGFGSNAAASVHPSVARDRIRAGATRAVERARSGELKLLDVGTAGRHRGRLPPRPRGRLRGDRPGAERIGDRTVRHAGPDPITAYRGFLAGVRLATLVESG